MKNSQELKLKGIPVSPGITISQVKVIKKKKIKLKERILKDEIEINEEIKKFDSALEKFQEILETLKKETKEENLKKLLDFQILVLKDEELKNDVISIIKNKKRNVEFAIQTSFKARSQNLFKDGTPRYLKERASEIEQIGNDLIEIINGVYTLEDNFPIEKVIVIESLNIEEALRIVKSNIRGVITEQGGKTEHSAIILRNFKIPAVYGIEKITKLLEDDEVVILDGGKGIVIINPLDSTLERYKIIKEDYERYELGLVGEKDLPAVTTDGKEIGIFANIDLPEEIGELAKAGKVGIGLFRTEMIFKEAAYDEHYQYKIYSEIANNIYPYSVTIRAFDIGGDKVYSDYKEDNPFLGLRGIRVLLEEQEIFQKQLRAVFRANSRGNIRFMLPMITTFEEIVEAKKIFIQTKKILEKEIKTTINQPRFGIMIETPSAVLLLEHMAELIDFVSIGTNDLTQYTLAVDRKNEKVSYIFNHLNPAILKLIKLTSDICKKKNILVSTCGEIASDPYGVVLLIGLGVDEISSNPSRIPEIKSLIRRISWQEAEELASKAISLPTANEVKSLVKEYVKTKMEELLEFYD